MTCRVLGSSSQHGKMPSFKCQCCMFLVKRNVCLSLHPIPFSVASSIAVSRKDVARKTGTGWKLM